MCKCTLFPIRTADSCRKYHYNRHKKSKQVEAHGAGHKWELLALACSKVAPLERRPHSGRSHGWMPSKQASHISCPHYCLSKICSNFATRNRFALPGAQLKGNAVKIGDSTRCCNSRRTWASFQPLPALAAGGKARPRGEISQKTCPFPRSDCDAFGS